MFAVIKTGGKQYRVAANETVQIEKLAGEAGESVTFGEVMMLGGDQPQVGAPLLDGASVIGEIVGQKRARKVIVFKKRRRQNYRRTRGHRQEFTLVRITDILAAGQTRSERNGEAEASSEPVAPKAPRTRRARTTEAEAGASEA